MPNMADIVVKKNDGVTNVTYTALVPSAGDKTPAIWKNNSVGTAAGHRPQLTLVSKDTGTGTARRVEFEFSYPSLVVGTDGKTNIAEKGGSSGSFLVPKGMADTDVAEYIAQCCNLLASALIVSCLKAGYAPT